MVGFLSVVFPFVTSCFILRKVQELKSNQAQLELIDPITLAILPKNNIPRPEGRGMLFW